MIEEDLQFSELPAPIRHHIEQLIADQRRKLDQNTVGVTELVYCPRKAFFRRKYEPKLFDAQKWWLYRGHIWHLAWGHLFGENAEVEVEHDAGDFKIIGHADIVYENCVYEIKTVSHLGNLPKQPHIEQIHAYAAMLGLSCAKLIYVNFSGFVVIPIYLNEEARENILRELEKRGRKLIEAIRSDIPPEDGPEYDWECEFCEVARFCILAREGKK